MKTLLLTSKHIASKEKANEITIDHIITALESVVFLDSQLKQDVLDFIETADVEQTQHITEDELNAIASKPKILYTEGASDFVEFLKSKGFTLSDTISELYISDKESNYKKNGEKLLELGKIKEILSSKIYDQEIAIESVKDTVSRAIFEKREDAVRAILFFVGPPATGKTYLTEETGKLLAQYGYKTKVFNMTMFSDDSSNLTGLREPYAGAGKGELSSYIESNPKSLIIFDEIEKCHIQKQQDLFRLLDRGFIEDKFDNSIINANDTILIFTSNLGKDIYERADYTKLIRDQKETESLLLQSIAKEKHERDKDMLAITPPLTSRLSASKIVLFNKVGLKAYFQMAQKEIDRYFEGMQKSFGFELVSENHAILAAFLQYLPFFDPRRIKGKIGDDIFDVIRDYIQSNEIDISTITKIKLTVSQELQELLDQNFVKDFGSLSFNDERFLELIDKKQTLFVGHNVSIKEDTLILTALNPKIEKIKNIQDFGGDVKIELDIPSGKIDGEPNANIFGHEDAKKMLVRIANKIKKFQELQRKNDPEASKVLANLPKGILLYGPPGTGKTKLARAFAAQVEIPIIVSSGKDMTTVQYTGTGIKQIKDIFKKAREYAPSILFIDEIDAVGMRGQDNSGEQDKNINALLEELDGFSKQSGKPVFVIAATNRMDRIDPAIIRPGRIEEHIKIPALSKQARRDFIAHMFANDDDFGEIDVDQFLKYTVGSNGAKLEMVFKKAKYQIELNREDSEDETLKIDLELLIEIVNEVEYGKRNTTKENAEFTTKMTAFHEAGHAILGLLVTPQITIEQITIASRADFGGFVKFNHEELQRPHKSFYEGSIQVGLAGRVAEEIFHEKNNLSLDEGISYGAIGDIEQATNLAYAMIGELGMDSEWGTVKFHENMSDTTKANLDKRVFTLMSKLKSKTKERLEKNWETVEKLAEHLVQEETIDGAWLYTNIKTNLQ
jgi:SpoVK/Ycf46/Vps4 family AAA+-type ATPase